MPLVVVLDALAIDKLPPGLDKFPLIAVGEPHTTGFEQIRMSGKARRTLDYVSSRTRLKEFLPLLEEIAERNAALDLLVEKSRRTDTSRPPFRPPAVSEAPELWDFIEGAVENLGSTERLLAEFRRASRYLFRASHTVYFLREEKGFRADRGASFCPADDPLVTYLSLHPLVLDGVDWPGPADPLAEMAVRNRLGMWGARLLVPMHENGHLVGMIAYGVRDDGQPYDEADKARAVSIARLLRQFLGQATQLGRLGSIYDRTRLGERYLPDTVVLDRDEQPSRSVPLAVRALIGEVRRGRDTRRLKPTAVQPFRASAGIVEETGGVWAFWEEASAEIDDRSLSERDERLAMLRDLALTLNHEIGNAMVSLNSLQHAMGHGDVPPAALLQSAAGDISHLAQVNSHLVHLSTLTEAEAAQVDLCELLKKVGQAGGLRVDVPPDPVNLDVVVQLIELALISIVQTVSENRPAGLTEPLALQLRSTGEAGEKTALVSVRGKGLELEGILSANVDERVPNQGRLTVFMAKEIIRLHRGEIHAGPGMDGTEILISLRRW